MVAHLCIQKIKKGAVIILKSKYVSGGKKTIDLQIGSANK